MDSLVRILALNLAVACIAVTIIWLVSRRLGDVSIVDVAWGGLGAAIAFVSFIAAEGAAPRHVLITGMAMAWGFRLSNHIGRRKWGKPEDFRYAAMRARDPDGFPTRSLFTVFLLQAVLMWAISAPVQLVHAGIIPGELRLLDFLGLAVWTVGFAFETVGDRQLRLFLADPANGGKVMDRGLWRYTRHPNYFGDSLIWWGIFLVAASTPWGWVTVFSPLLMTFFLLKVSGVPLLEEALAERREGYREYMERTSSFVPWPPKKG
jgi:steroid 5-alpha reductase family enzyme